MKTPSSIGLDSNILIYAYNASSLFHPQALDIIKSARDKRLEASIAPQNVFEFYATITRTRFTPKPASPAKALALMLDYLFSGAFTIIIPNHKTLFHLDQLLKTKSPKRGAHIFDLFLAATLLSHGITTLYTQNTQDFTGIKGLKVVNPLK